MGSMNKAIIIGYLGRDPESRRTNSGKMVVSLSVATSEKWRDKASGEQRQRTEWHKVVIFNEGLAKVAEQYLRKGKQVYIEGQLQTRKWTDKDGHERYTTEIVLMQYNGALVLLGGRGDDDDGDGEREESIGRAAGKSLAEDIDDEIPF
jgi:single-strand DNA-binding protein